MPRIVRRVGDDESSSQFASLAAELAGELGADRSLAQPIIDEQHYPAGNAVRVVVIWDKFDALSEDQRTAVIFDAYKIIEGQDFCDRIALAAGMTVPEAIAAGLVPYQVTPAVRRGDRVTLDECNAAMQAQGASTLLDPDRPQLRFSRIEDAEECVRRLSQVLPGSEPIWVVHRDLYPSGLTGYEVP